MKRCRRCISPARRLTGSSSAIFAVFIGFIASYLPFAVFPLLLSMRRIPPELMAAARDLGAGFWRAFFTILVPLTYAGLFAGFLFVFVMVAGSSTEVQMLGGAGASIVSVMINDVMRVANYPLAFAIFGGDAHHDFRHGADRQCLLQAVRSLRGGCGMMVK